MRRSELTAVIGSWFVIGLIVLYAVSGSHVNAINPFWGKACLRLDDIQDFWLEETQTALIDLFLSDSVKVTLGVIPGLIGIDQKVIDRVQYGVKQGLFEVALHGWMNEDFSEMDYQQQSDLIRRGRSKLEKVFPGVKVDTFIPSMNRFNDDTLKVCRENGLRFLSASWYTDSVDWDSPVKHLPVTVPTADFRIEDGKGSWTHLSAESIIESIKDSLDKDWFVILEVHPQQFYKWVDGLPLQFDIESFNEFRLVLDWMRENTSIMQIRDLGNSGRFGIGNYRSAFGIPGLIIIGVALIFYIEKREGSEHR